MPATIKTAHASIFQLDYKYHAYEPGIKFRILEMTINGSGVHNISVYST